MVRSQENILLIGDDQRTMRAVVEQAMPLAQVTAVDSYFDGIAELSGGKYTAVVASVEPIERRPESALRTLRHLAGEARVVLFGHPTLEPLSRKMLDFGCDDYLITPTSPGELHQVFGAPLLRIAAAVPPAMTSPEEPAGDADAHPLFSGIPLAQIILAAMTEHPVGAIDSALAQINRQLGPTMQVVHQPPGPAAPPSVPEGMICLTHAIRSGDAEVGQLHLLVPHDEDAATARHFLAHLADLLGRMHQLEDRHKRLQRLAITDELTGLFNARYFRHFLGSIIERARMRRFPVTLFVFDIDNFKKYNDSFGHAVGDQILKQTAGLARRCCREHDLVARIGGDEFAVVFWEKEGPRQPKNPKSGGTSTGRAPQTPLDILNRFRRLLATESFSLLGPSGRGVLTISGGIAIYPYDARNMEELIQAADKELMFRAKQSGKNSIFLVGSEQQIAPPENEGT